MEATLHSPLIARLVAGFADLTHPELRLDDMLKELTGLLEAGEGASAAELYCSERAAWLVPGGSTPRVRSSDERGELVVGFCHEFTKVVDGVCGPDGGRLRANPTEARRALRALRQPGKALHRQKLEEWVSGQLNAQFKRRKDEVATFSAHLSRYQRSDSAVLGPLDVIELPGQYAGDAPPEPLSHVQLEAVAPLMRTMRSLRKPKVIALQGTDQREYRFLAKVGLRLSPLAPRLCASAPRPCPTHDPCCSCTRAPPWLGGRAERICDSTNVCSSSSAR